MPYPLIHTRTCAYQGVGNVSFGKLLRATKWMAAHLNLSELELRMCSSSVVY